jgi:hypothetical protein
MAKYGLNFNGTPIPEGYARKFVKRMKFEGAGRNDWVRLQGVAETRDEAEWMKMQADNGHRKILIVERASARGMLFGLYVS